MDGVQAMMLKQPKTLEFALFLKPFHWQVWLVFHLLWLFYSFILTFISMISKKLVPASSEPRDDFTFWESHCYFSVGSIQLGPDKHPVSLGGKVLHQTWSFLYVILIATYTANLAAIFSKNSTLKPVQSIDDIHNSLYNVCANARFEKEFVTYNNSILNELIMKERIQYFIMGDRNWSRIVSETLQSDCIWLVPNTNIDSIIQYLAEKDRVYALDGYFNRIPQGFAMKTKWKHAENVSKLIAKYTQSGIVEEITRDHQSILLDDAGEEDVKPIELISFAGIFCLVFTAGLVAPGLTAISLYRDKRLKCGS